MKRFLWVLGGFYIILISAFLLTRNTGDDFIHFITMREEISQIMSSAEPLNLVVYVDDTDRFIEDVDLIDDAQLRGDDLSIQVKIQNIDIKDTFLQWKDVNYYKTVFSIVFTEITIFEYHLLFENSILDIQFSNGKLLSLPFGNINLKFSDFEGGNHLEMIKMAGIPDPANSRLQAVVITLEKHSVSAIELIGFGMMTSSLQINCEDILILSDDDIEQVTSNLNELILSHNDISSEPIRMEEQVILYVPIAYDEDSLSCPRFPILIQYEYLGNQYEYDIDDFVFYQRPFHFEEENANEFIVTHYYVGKR